MFLFLDNFISSRTRFGKCEARGFERQAEICFQCIKLRYEAGGVDPGVNIEYRARTMAGDSFFRRLQCGADRKKYRGWIWKWLCRNPSGIFK